MAKKPKKPKKPVKAHTMFEANSGSLARKNKHCPKCGPGVFLANHKNRFSCGKCGYAEMLKK